MEALPANGPSRVEESNKVTLAEYVRLRTKSAECICVYVHVCVWEKERGATLCELLAILNTELMPFHSDNVLLAALFAYPL